VKDGKVSPIKVKDGEVSPIKVEDGERLVEYKGGRW
jgi:hypothetical protein